MDMFMEAFSVLIGSALGTITGFVALYLFDEWQAAKDREKERTYAASHVTVGDE